MVFSSAVFLFVFLPAVFLLDRLLPGIRAKNALLLIASLIFYAFGQPVYLPLLLLSVLLNYVCGRMAAGKHARLGVALAVIGGIGMLAVFKYADFLIGSLNSAFGLALPLTGIALPIGISFFTFQGLSYVIDVYRDRTVVSRSFVKVLLYIAYFPQLIAGPIVKYHDIEKEIDDRRTTPQETAHGIRRFICGLSKKLLLSNAMGRMADAVFTLPAGEIGMFAAWMGAICYTLQIYFDFSGYSDMAIGMGRMFGFHFQENFNFGGGGTSRFPPGSAITCMCRWAATGRDAAAHGSIVSSCFSPPAYGMVQAGILCCGACGTAHSLCWRTAACCRCSACAGGWRDGSIRCWWSCWALPCSVRIHWRRRVQCFPPCSRALV